MILEFVVKSSVSEGEDGEWRRRDAGWRERVWGKRKRREKRGKGEGKPFLRKGPANYPSKETRITSELGNNVKKRNSRFLTRVHAAPSESASSLTSFLYKPNNGIYNIFINMILYKPHLVPFFILVELRRGSQTHVNSKRTQSSESEYYLSCK